MVGVRCSLVAMLLVGGCDKQGSVTPPPDTVASKPEPEPEPVPEPEPEPADTEETESPDPEAEEPEEERLTPEDGFEAADSTAGELLSGTSYFVTPALPVEWPPKAAVVMYLVYPLDPIKGGAVDEYTCRQPSLAITFGVDAERVDHEELKGTKKLGKLKQERRSASDPIHGAEAALFDVVLGKRSVEKSKYLLNRYSAWLDKHPTVAKDLRRRLPAFVRFVESAK